MTDVAAGLAATCVGLAALAYVTEIICRYVLNAPLNWSADFGSYMLFATVFLGVPKVTAEGEHPSISFAVDRMRGLAKARYHRLLFLVCAAVVGCVGCFVVRELLRQYDQGVLTALTNQVPRWWLTAVAAVGLSLTALQFVRLVGATPDEPASA